MNRWIAVLAILVLGGCASSGTTQTLSDDGIIRVQSSAGVEVTVKRLKAALWLDLPPSQLVGSRTEPRSS